MTIPEHGIRRAIKAQMQRLGVSNADLARKLGVKPPHVSRVVSRQSARIPDSLLTLLAALDLELTVRPRAEGERPLTAAGIPYTGDPETDAVLNDHPDILERVAKLESGEGKLISLESLLQELGVRP